MARRSTTSTYITSPFIYHICVLNSGRALQGALKCIKSEYRRLKPTVITLSDAPPARLLLYSAQISRYSSLPLAM